MSDPSGFATMVSALNLATTQAPLLVCREYPPSNQTSRGNSLSDNSKKTPRPTPLPSSGTIWAFPL